MKINWDSSVFKLLKWPKSVLQTLLETSELMLCTCAGSQDQGRDTVGTTHPGWSPSALGLTEKRNDSACCSPELSGPSAVPVSCQSRYTVEAPLRCQGQLTKHPGLL